MKEVSEAVMSGKTMTRLVNKGKNYDAVKIEDAGLSEFSLHIDMEEMNEEFVTSMYQCAICKHGFSVFGIDVLVTCKEDEVFFDVSFSYLRGNQIEREKVFIIKKEDGAKIGKIEKLYRGVYKGLVDRASIHYLSTFLTDLWNGIQVAILESGMDCYKDHAKVGVKA